jgi:DNA-directed RNA polymerase specialized sigma24 family protein
LASGRSVDSAKRRNNQLEWERDSYDLDGMVDENKADNSVFAWVSARDIVSLLSSQLSGQEKAVLDCFAEGLGPREIGRKLRMSHTMVIKHRRKIATLFNRLDPPISLHAGIPPNGNSGNNGNGNSHGLKTNGFNRSLQT